MVASVQKGAPSDWATPLKEVSEVMIQTLIRIVFIAGSILMTDMFLHAALLPLVGLSVTWLAAHFFPKTESLIPFFSPSPAPVLEPPPLPVQGLANLNQNCAFNSIVHFLQSDPKIVQWLAAPSDNPFVRVYQYFLKTRDSQIIRLALPVNPSPRVQMDAGEILTHILDQVPDAEKMCVETIREGCDPQRERAGFLTLEIEENSHRLEEILHKYMHPDPVEMGEGRTLNTTLRFAEPPAALRFQLKRFHFIQPPKSLLTQFLPAWFPGMGWRTVKNDASIEVPNELEVNGQRYRLSSFVNHLGETCDRGHYIAARVVGEERFFLNDQIVTLADPLEWERRVQKAYLLLYVPV